MNNIVAASKNSAHSSLRDIDTEMGRLPTECISLAHKYRMKHMGCDGRPVVLTYPLPPSFLSVLLLLLLGENKTINMIKGTVIISADRYLPFADDSESEIYSIALARDAAARADLVSMSY